MTSDFSTTLVLSAEDSLDFLSSLVHPDLDASNKREAFLDSLNTMDININQDGSMDIYVSDIFLPMSFSLSSVIETDDYSISDLPGNSVEFNYTYDTSSSLTTDSDYIYTNESTSPDTDFIRSAA